MNHNNNESRNHSSAYYDNRLNKDDIAIIGGIGALVLLCAIKARRPRTLAENVPAPPAIPVYTTDAERARFAAHMNEVCGEFSL